MGIETVDTVVVGAGQAGLAMSAHLGVLGVDHVVLERNRIADRWKHARWDSLVMNGPAWHDRFPAMEFSDSHPDAFPGKESVVSYFETFADKIKAPIRCGVDVQKVEARAEGYSIKTNQGTLEANNIVAATGPFQIPVFPKIIPEDPALTQMHSSDYKNPQQLDAGAVLVIGAGSSGSQIADELLRAGRRVFLSVGPHDRPPRQYRGKDFVWWLGVLGKWQMKTPPAGREHVTIAVSGAYGGKTIDFRRFAERGMTLLGMAGDFKNGVLTFAGDLADNIAEGDANYLSLLQEADQYIEENGLDFPQEPDAKIIGSDPDCITHPISALHLSEEGISTIIWATGYVQNFDWLKVDAFDQNGKPDHKNGVSKLPGIYFVGLPWLSMRGSSFIWGVWEDAKFLASHIAER
ncbi:MAG: NAD(P)/FAD-dependent oxidoreductase [Pseudomonadota bacterium]